MVVAMAVLRSMMPVSMRLLCSDLYFQLLFHLQFVLLLPPHLLVAAYLLLAAKPLEVEQQLLQPWHWHAQFSPCHTRHWTVYPENESYTLAYEPP